MIENNYYFKIVDILICVKIPFKFKVSDESKVFICSKEKDEDITIKFIPIENSLNIEGELVFKNTINIYKNENKFIHESYPAPGHKPYAWLIKINDFYYEIYYLKGKEHYFEYSRNILNSICIEQLLNKNNAFILHSSFIKWKNKAILFSAPSGTGKSTQANLWNKYEGTEIINGDKAGLRNLEGNWFAYGLPFAGTSNIYKNEKVPVSNIIILRQGKENKIKKLSKSQAFIKIYSETIVHTWDNNYQDNIINQISDLVEKIPVYLYECLPNKEAVDFLKLTLEEDENETKISRT